MSVAMWPSMGDNLSPMRLENVVQVNLEKIICSLHSYMEQCF